MSDFSKDPKDVLKDNLNQGYIGIHFYQGVPVLDRDLNLLNDLISERLKSALQQIMGDGVCSEDAGYVTPNGNLDFKVEKGKCIMEGVEYDIPNISSYNEYKKQQKTKNNLATLEKGSKKNYTVYLSFLEEKIQTDNSDIDLKTPTAEKIKVEVQLHCVEHSIGGENILKLAKIEIDNSGKVSITDERQFTKIALQNMRDLLWKHKTRWSHITGKAGDKIKLLNIPLKLIKHIKACFLFDTNAEIFHSIDNNIIEVTIPPKGNSETGNTAVLSIQTISGIPLWNTHFHYKYPPLSKMDEVEECIKKIGTIDDLDNPAIFDHIYKCILCPSDINYCNIKKIYCICLERFDDTGDRLVNIYKGYLKRNWNWFCGQPLWQWQRWWSHNDCSKKLSNIIDNLPRKSDGCNKFLTNQ
jgi:hypothetical protein